MTLNSLVSQELLTWLKKSATVGHHLARISPHPITSKLARTTELRYNHYVQLFGSNDSNRDTERFVDATLIIYVGPTPHYQLRALRKAAEVPVLHRTTSQEEARAAGFAFQIVRPTADESSLYLVQQQLLEVVKTISAEEVRGSDDVVFGRQVGKA